MNYITIFESTYPIENELYWKRYQKFINHKLNRSILSTETHKHHICPRSMFRKYENLKEHPWNCVLLTYREHYIAHYLLMKAVKNNMVHAFHCMNSAMASVGYFNSRLYEYFVTKYMKSIEHFNTGRIKLSNGNHEISVHEDELEYYLSIGYSRGRNRKILFKVTNGVIERNVYSEEDFIRYSDEGFYKGSLNKGTSDTVKMNKDGKEYNVPIDEILEYEKNGYTLGRRKFKMNANFLPGSIFITDGKKSKKIFPEEYETYESQGWKRGRTVHKKK